MYYHNDHLVAFRFCFDEFVTFLSLPFVPYVNRMT